MSNLFARNITSSAITTEGFSVFSINSESAETVIVQNASHQKYRAFKCIINDVSYYYVIDGIHTVWTDNLSSIGYSLYLMPIVRSHSGTQTAASIAADASFDTGMEWDSGNLYIGETNDGQGNVTRYGWEAVEAMPVVNLTAYPNAANNQQSLPMVGDGVVYSYILYDENGHWLPTGHTYNLEGYHATVDGPLLPMDGTGIYLLADTMYGRMKLTSNGSVRVSVQRIEYTVS